MVSVALDRRVVGALRCQALGFRKPRAFILLLLECLFCEEVDIAGTSFWKEGRISRIRQGGRKKLITAQNTIRLAFCKSLVKEKQSPLSVIFNLELFPKAANECCSLS